MSIQLAPEIEARLREEAAALGVSVDEFLRNALAAYRRPPNGAASEVRRGPYTDRKAEMSWVSHSDPQFIGK